MGISHREQIDMTIEISNPDSVDPVSDEALAAAQEYLEEISDNVTWEVRVISPHQYSSRTRYIYHFHIQDIPDSAIPVIRELRDRFRKKTGYVPEKRYLTVSREPKLFYTKYGVKKANKYGYTLTVDLEDRHKEPESI